LRRLDLRFNDLGPEQAALIAASPRLRKLRELDLGSNAIGGRGLAAIARSPHLTGLRKLYLFHNQLGASLELLRERFGTALRG